jgi:hypothetical protein
MWLDLGRMGRGAELFGAAEKVGGRGVVELRVGGTCTAGEGSRFGPELFVGVAAGTYLF